MRDQNIMNKLGNLSVVELIRAAHNKQKERIMSNARERDRERISEGIFGL